MLTKSVVKHIRELQQKKYRKEFKEFIVEGVKGVGEALLSEFEVIMVVFQGDLRDEQDFKELIKICTQKSIPFEFCGRNEVDQIKSTETFPGVMAVIVEPDVVLDKILDGSPIVCLDGVKDPGNLGTIIRTADWFGVKNILLSEDTVDPYNEKVVRSTMGSVFREDIFLSTNLVHTLEKLKKDGYQICILNMDGKPLEKLPQKKVVYVFGSESHGVRDEVEKMANKIYTIPGKGGAESLNVSVAAAILLYSL